MATTANDIVTGALLNIGAYSLGDPADNNIANLGLNLLNDLLDSLSNDEAFVYTQAEYTFQWVSGKYQYSVGCLWGCGFGSLWNDHVRPGGRLHRRAHGWSNT